MFQTSHPVSGATFHNRTAEIARLELLLRELRAGTARWLAIIGPRKIGKSSLMLELSRRARDVAVIAVDAQEVSPPSLEIFRTCALRTVDCLLGAEIGSSIEILAATGAAGDAVSALLDESATFSKLPPRVKAAIRALPRGEMTDDFARVCLDLPERLAEALDARIVVAIDEFQELATVRGPGRKAADPLPLVRSTWQRHQRVAYIVSGSGRSMLEEMVTREHSPFFQHFDVMYMAPFPAPEAVTLLTRESPTDRPIPEDLARRAVAMLGGHPFYLQLLGEALTADEPPYDDAALKAALQSVLFSRSGRLALYLQLGYERTVGRSGFLAATLDALADGPARMTDVARRIGASTADTARYLERLGDTIRHLADSTYTLDDPVLGLWLRWRRPGGSVVPMTVVGDEAEREVAALLARMGFDLVYQSRASRGSFDLLATRGALQLGVQVKRSPLPLRFERAAWSRMQADAARMRWRWAIASVEPGGAVVFLDPAKSASGRAPAAKKGKESAKPPPVRRTAATAKEVRVGDGAIIENLVTWLEAER